MGLNWRDDRALALRWLAQLGNPYVSVAYRSEGRTAIDWGVYGAPETFLIDADGIVVKKHIGPLTLEIWAARVPAAPAGSRGGPADAHRWRSSPCLCWRRLARRRGFGPALRRSGRAGALRAADPRPALPGLPKREHRRLQCDARQRTCGAKSRRSCAQGGATPRFTPS